MFAWLPIESIIHDNQKEYYNAINLSNQNGESTVFIEFMLSVIKQALKEACSVSENITQTKSKQDVRLDKIFRFLENHEYIMNNDVQRLLNISSATATRILTNFTKSGILKKLRFGSHWGYTKK